ncbi:MAG: acetyltransferase [Muribaculaceae bacterium]|nr:acetyltransferase [Muribaculaceae bacterium]
MRNLPYHLLAGVLTILALLPLPMLYVLADLLFFLVYHVVRYRRKLVSANLAACFPEKSEAERKAIEKAFYHNFADYIVETIKLLHISDATMSGRMQFDGLDIIDSLVGSGRSIIVYFAHCGNWEWAPSMTLHVAHKPSDSVKYCQVYRPLRSHTFDRLMLKVRSRFGSLSFAKKTVLRDLIMLRKEDITSVTGFMSDQKPSHGDPTVVTTFLGRPTAFISGTETLARKLGMAAIYWDTEKISRGHYRITCRLLADEPEALPPHELTLRYARALEATIRRNPSIWLWTHNRWKIPVQLPR